MLVTIMGGIGSRPRADAIRTRGRADGCCLWLTWGGDGGAGGERGPVVDLREALHRLRHSRPGATAPSRSRLFPVPASLLHVSVAACLGVYMVVSCGMSKVVCGK